MHRRSHASKIARLLELREEYGNSSPCEISIGPKAALQFGVARGADRFLDELAELRAIGVSWVHVDPPHSCRAQYLESIHWLKEEVIAALVEA